MNDRDNSDVWIIVFMVGILALFGTCLANRDRMDARQREPPKIIFGTEYRGFSFASLICLCIPQYCTRVNKEEIALTIDPDFAWWMAFAHPEVARYRNRETYCCIWFCIPMCLPCDDAFDDPELSFTEYLEEYKLHLEYKPGSEKMIEAKKHFEILMEEGRLW